MCTRSEKWAPPGAGRTTDIHTVINHYATDYNNLLSHSSAYPTPQSLRDVVKQGATSAAPSAGYSSQTQGSQWIVDRAREPDDDPLYILVWGSITDVAQAVHDAPDIIDDIRIYSIGSWNTQQDQAARNYLYNNHSDELWWIEADSTFRGMYAGGNTSGDLGNATFVTQHVVGHGALGDFFGTLEPGGQREIKMGDTPSLLYLMRGNPDTPTTDHWGGAFVRPSATTRPTYWHDNPDPALVEWTVYPGAKTVNKWRENYLRDWQTRMDWADAPASGTTPAAPNSLTAAAVSSSQINLTWNDNSNNETGFKIERKTGANGTWSQIATVGANVESYPNTGLSAGTQYFYRVRSYISGVANSNYSNEANATTQQQPGTGNVTITNVSSGRSYTVGTATVGLQYYIDRTFQITNLSANLQNQAIIRTANDDKSLTTPSHLTFNLAQQSMVYVAYDVRATSIPAWLSSANGWTLTSETFNTNDGASPFKVYAKTFPAGSVTLGGNLQSPAAGAGSNYSVIVRPTAGVNVTVNSVSTGKAYNVQTAAVGSTLYIDRTYTITGLSSNLVGKRMIRTANDDKYVANVSSHLTFTIDQQATVYVAYDKRQTSLPSWLSSANGWTLSSESMASTGAGAASPYLVYAKTFSAGTVTLGSNWGFGAAGADAHYVVFVG